MSNLPTPVALPSGPRVSARTDGIVAVGLVGILFVMMVPLPAFMLDMLLTLNIAISLGVLLTAFYADRPLDFGIFPGLLLLTTLFRLSLNVASVRLILSEGRGGALIEAFGHFVVGGNYVVGAVVFFVLTLINFVVITKGSSRIAEVAARFTLDALPGKQMAIDADLNAGLLGEAEARQRRDDVGREADFYGAMDGASKFVRGDAIAALVITAINVIGGLIVGVLQLNMSLPEAAQTFVLLAIGDGLVSQIPALLISTAAGIIVARASGRGTLAGELGAQMFTRSAPLMITAGFLAVFGLVPGLPILPFWGLAAAAAYVGRRQMGVERAAKELADRPEAPVAVEEAGPEGLLFVDPLELEIGYGLISIVDPAQGGDLLERVRLLRQQLALELGIVIPPVRIRDNPSLQANRYSIKLRGNPVSSGEALPGYHLALVTEGVEVPPGIRATDPAFGLPAVWVAERHLPEAERAGMTAVEAPAVVTTHLLEVLRKYAYRLLDRQETKKLIEKVRETSPALVDELVPGVLTIGTIQKVLKRLLQERVPVRDLVTILEALADHVGHTKNVEVLTEYARTALAPTITRGLTSHDGQVHGFVLDPLLEQHLLSLAEGGRLTATTMGLEADRADQLAAEADRLSKRLLADGHMPVLITSPVLRALLYGFLSSTVPDLSVLSYNDLMPDAPVHVEGHLSLP